MSDDSFGRFFPAICAGFGLFLIGAVNLLLHRRSWALRVPATLLTCLLTLSAAAAINQPGTLRLTALMLGGGLGVCLVLGSGRVASAVAKLVGSLQQPLVRYGLLAIAGGGLVIGSIVTFEQATEAEADRAMLDLELLGGRTPSVPAEQKATTDQGSTIVLKTPVTVREESQLAGPEGRLLRESQLDAQIIRRGPADGHSNCHGWVFTGGRFVLSPEDVEVILKENGYHEVQTPQPGDLVVYRQNGAIAHSAIIRYVAEGRDVLVESKWGDLGVFLHPAEKSTYGTDYVFHRSPRAGHLLVGVGGTAPPASTPATGMPTMATE